MFDIGSMIALPGAQEGEWMRCTLVPAALRFDIRVRYLNNQEWRAAGRDARPGTTEAAERRLADQIVADWRGLTAKTMQALFPGITDQQLSALPDQGIPCNTDTRVQILRHHSALFDWVYMLSSNRKAWVEARDATREIEAEETRAATGLDAPR